eukprot:191648_1
MMNKTQMETRELNQKNDLSSNMGRKVPNYFHNVRFNVLDCCSKMFRINQYPFVAMMSYWLLWADLFYRIIRTMVSTRPKHDAPSTASGTNTFPIEELIIGACSFYSIYCYQRYFRIQTLLNYYLSTGRDSLLFW